MRLRPRLIVLFLGLCVSLNLFGQEPTRLSANSIAVLPFVNETGDPRWDSLAQSLADTISLTVQLSGQFVYREIEGFDPYASDGSIQLRRTAAATRTDAIVFGRLRRTATGRVELEAALFGRNRNTVIGRETREAFGDFDILDAADELVLIATSAILGFRVDFGALLLRPDRDDIPFRVYVDGVAIGDQITGVPQLLVGQRTIEIAVLGSGREQFVYSADRLIRPGEAVDIAISLPDVVRGTRSEVDARHEFVNSLLGQYAEAHVARAALEESARLIDVSDGAQAEEQRVLEASWDLEGEFASLTIDRYRLDGDYVPEEPFAFIERATELAEQEPEITGDLRVSSRIERNATAHLALLRLRWSFLLANDRWEEAQSLLEDITAVGEQFELAHIGANRRTVRQFDTALATAETFRDRSSRRWPYVGGAVGLGAIGYGGYLLAADAVGTAIDDADRTFDDYQAASDPATAERLRARANDQYDEAELLEIVQWSSIAFGVAVAVASGVVGIRNRRAAENYLRGWARDRHGREIALAERLFDGSLELSDGESSVLLVGPPEASITIGRQVDVLPTLVVSASGTSLATSRPTVVATDASRLLDSGLQVMVVR